MKERAAFLSPKKPVFGLSEGVLAGYAQTRSAAPKVRFCYRQ